MYDDVSGVVVDSLTEGSNTIAQKVRSNIHILFHYSMRFATVCVVYAVNGKVHPCMWVVLENPRAEFQIIRSCSIAWARFLPTVMPRRGIEDAASETYVRGIDAAISDQLERLLGDPKVRNPGYAQFV